jgi:hypothetical protein
MIMGCQEKVPFDYVIIEEPFEYDSIYFKGYIETFKMSRKEFEFADKELIKTLIKEHDIEINYLNPTTIYDAKRQYFPYVNEKGERIIFINGFKEMLMLPTEISSGIYEDRPIVDWNKQIVWPDDGGDEYWRIWINLSTGENRMMINGPHRFRK